MVENARGRETKRSCAPRFISISMHGDWAEKLLPIEKKASVGVFENRHTPNTLFQLGSVFAKRGACFGEPAVPF